MSNTAPRATAWLLLLTASVVSGVILSFAYPPVSIGPLSLVAVVPLLVALFRHRHTRKQFFWAGYLFGVGFFTCHLYWIADLIPASSITMPWIMVPALLLLVAYLSVYTGLALLLTGSATPAASQIVVDFPDPNLEALIKRAAPFN